MVLTRSVKRRLIIAAAVIAAMAAIYGALSWSGTMMYLLDGDAMREYVVRLGWFGPAAVVVLMSIAIVLSPIPSAPIAIASGAAYGHLWGAVYVGTGAGIGAVIAFCIARVLGREAMVRWFGDRISVGWLGSQNALMAIVFVTRLLPFLSFDLVSYAAGLTPLTFWRFVVATLLGIAPASFLLAHFGHEFASADARRVGVVVLALGTITLVPVMAKVLLDWRRRKRSAKPPV